MKAEKKIKVILDNDIGDDIDDAFAVALAAKSPEIELLGVTTVFRNCAQRSKMAVKLLRELGSDAKVYAGANFPFIQKVEDIMPEQFKVKERFGDDGLYIIPQWDDVYSGIEYESKHAVDFIIESALQNPGELVLVPVGPMTNIAMAIRREPAIIPCIKNITLMGGWEKKDYPEWNVASDPEAAHIVYTSGIPVYAVGLDVTLQTRWTPEMMKRFKEKRDLSSVTLDKMMTKWFDFYNFDCPIMHDPLTIAWLSEPSLLKFERKLKRIGLCGSERGFVFDEEKESNKCAYVNIAVSVDTEKYLNMFSDRILN